jgi:hypothetical protein
LCPVLGEATVAGLEIPELALDHPEGVFDPRPHHRDDPVDFLVDAVQCAALSRLLKKSGSKDVVPSAAI